MRRAYNAEMAEAAGNKPEQGASSSAQVGGNESDVVEFPTPGAPASAPCPPLSAARSNPFPESVACSALTSLRHAAAPHVCGIVHQSMAQAYENVLCPLPCPRCAVGSVFLDMTYLMESQNGTGGALPNGGGSKPSIDDVADAAMRANGRRPSLAQTEKMMKGWLAKAKSPARGRKKSMFFKRFSLSGMSGAPAPAGPEANAVNGSGRTSEAEDPEQSAAVRAAHVAKQRAASTAMTNEQRMENEVRLQRYWRIHMRGAAGLEAEIAKMHASETAKQILREWEAEEEVIRQHRKAAKEAERDLKRRLMEKVDGGSRGGPPGMKENGEVKSVLSAAALAPSSTTPAASSACRAAQAVPAVSSASPGVPAVPTTPVPGVPVFRTGREQQKQQSLPSVPPAATPPQAAASARPAAKAPQSAPPAGATTMRSSPVVPALGKLPPISIPPTKVAEEDRPADAGDYSA